MVEGSDNLIAAQNMHRAAAQDQPHAAAVAQSSSAPATFGVPWLEEDHVADTQQFIERIDKHLIEYMLDKSDRLGKDDVEESDRRFVDPFICPICLSIADRAIQCGNCKQIFHQQCIKQWLSQGGSKCSQCKAPFVPEEQNRNLNNIIDQIRIKCPHCQQIFQLSDRFNHIKNCESTKVLGCPMNCTSATAKTFRTLKQHIVQECSNEILNC